MAPEPDGHQFPCDMGTKMLEQPQESGSYACLMPESSKWSQEAWSLWHGFFGFCFVFVFPSCPDFFWLVNTFDSIMSSSFILLDLSLWNFSGEAKPIGYIQRLILRNSPMWLWGLTSGKSGCSHRSWCCLESEICRTGQEVGNSGWIFVTILRQDSVFSMKPRFLSEDHQLI